MKYLYLFLLFLFGIDLSQSQTLPKEDVMASHIRLKTGAQKNKIVLRWAVDEPVAWQKANKIGFNLKRYTLMRDGQLLEEPEEKNLGTFLSKPLNDWKLLIEQNDNAAIVAQSLYGESFEVELGEKKGSIEGIVNKSQEIEQRFAFALMAADLDFEIAKLAGWGYTDNEVKTNERYLYTVTLNKENNKNKLQIEKGDAIASIEKPEELPALLGFIGIYQDQTVTLAWEYLQLKDTYTAYFIEKAEDGASFKSLGDLPVVNMNDKLDKPAQGMIYVDSLAQNNKNFTYRIRGKTIFGEYGPYSNVVSGSGKKALEATPRISKFDIGKDNESITLNWEFPKEAEKDILSFELIHSETDEENSYKTIKDKIPAIDRTLVTKSQSAANYYKIRAIGKNRDQRESFAVLVQPDDSTPPAIPTEFKGKIDSTGLAHLEWKPNIEKDLDGYHIFRGTQKGEELVRLTPQAVDIAKYTDTIKLENLNSKVYYYVTSIDKRNNQSEASEIIELEKPDKVKPQAPVFAAYKLENTGINLNWIKSYSEDVTVHQLYRQALDGTDKLWKMIFETKEILPNYTYKDEDVTADHRYKYYLLAIDKNQLKSDKSQEVTLRSVDLRSKSVISNLSGNADYNKKKISLSWKIESKDVGEIIVYRSEAGKKPTLWGTLDGTQNFLEDKNVQVGNQYTYLIKAMLNNNQPAKTEKIDIQY